MGASPYSRLILYLGVVVDKLFKGENPINYKYYGTKSCCIRYAGRNSIFVCISCTIITN